MKPIAMRCSEEQFKKIKPIKIERVKRISCRSLEMETQNMTIV